MVRMKKNVRTMLTRYATATIGKLPKQTSRQIHVTANPRRLAGRIEHFKNKTKIDRGYLNVASMPHHRESGLYGRIIRQAGLLAQLRSSPTTHISTSQVAPIMPKSSPIR